MAQEQVSISCNTIFYVEDAVDSGVYVEVEDVTTYSGEIGNVGTFLETTTQKDCVKTYTAGLSDSPDLTVSFFWSGTTNQSNFQNAAIAGETRAAKIVFADSLITAEFSLSMAGFTLSDPVPDTIITANVSGKIDRVIWS